MSSPTPAPTVAALPILTVAAASDLLLNGDLDGRFAAVGGFWYSAFLPCPYMPHIASLAERCGFGVMVDQRTDNPFGANIGFSAESVHGRISPAIVAESAASFAVATDNSYVVVIIHVADPRLWQCSHDQVSFCQRRPVLDRIVSVDGQDINPAQFQTGAFNMTFDDANAAALAAAGGGQVVHAYALDAMSLNDVDPRFISDHTGVVWYARVITGAPDGNGAAAGVDVLMDDSTSALIQLLPQAIDLSQQPARVVLDARPPQGVDSGQFKYVISVGDETLADGSLDSSSVPLVLAPGDYVVRGTVESNAITHDTQPCELPLSLEAGADVSFYAQFELPSGCTWQQGSAFP